MALATIVVVALLLAVGAAAEMVVVVDQAVDMDNVKMYNHLTSSFDMRANVPSAGFSVFVIGEEDEEFARLRLGFGNVQANLQVVSPYDESADFHVIFGPQFGKLDLASIFGGAVAIVFNRLAILQAPKDVPLDALETLVDRHSDQASMFRLPARGLAPLRQTRLPSLEQITKKLATIEELIAQVSAANLEANVTTLANNFGTPNSRNSVSDGLDEAQVFVADYFRSIGLTVTTHMHQPNHALNTIATRIGSGPAPRASLIVGAHLDSRNTGSTDTTRPAPGADDNGSGTAAVLELARIIQGSDIAFTHDLVFALWSGEEQGLLGSRSYASELDDENADLVAYINVDMIGYRVNAASVLSLMTGSATPAVNNAIRAACATYMPQLEIGSTGACCSDQQSFFENGFPSASFFEHEGGAGSYPCYHQVCDTPDQLDYEMLEENTQCFLAATAVLAEPI